jgi:hypothetical protein
MTIKLLNISLPDLKGGYLKRICFSSPGKISAQLLFFALLILSQEKQASGIKPPMIFASDSSAKPITDWYKGNTHTHARFSDKNDKNDVPEIAKWYRKAGYNFLVISEHNDLLTKKKVICHAEADHAPDFIMLCGLELSENRHLTALGITKFIHKENSLQDGVDRTVDAGGFPILNHPMRPVVKAADFIKTTDLNHLEVFNGNSPQDTPNCEQLWDSVLSAPKGRIVYAVASDDNHYTKSKVGRGWIMVDAPSLTDRNILESIRDGKFYASTGIYLTGYQITRKSITVRSSNGTRVTFIGKNGRTLKTVNAPGASIQIKGDEGYIRIKITNEEGIAAWTQPVMIK